MGAESDSTMMIGDTTYDMLTGRNAGTKAIGVTWGVHTQKELSNAGAHHVVKSFDELENCIQM